MGEGAGEADHKQRRAARKRRWGESPLETGYLKQVWQDSTQRQPEEPRSSLPAAQSLAARDLGGGACAPSQAKRSREVLVNYIL